MLAVCWDVQNSHTENIYLVVLKMMDHDYGFQGMRGAPYKGHREGTGSVPHLPGGYNHYSPQSRHSIDHRKKSWKEPTVKNSERQTGFEKSRPVNVEGGGGRILSEIVKKEGPGLPSKGKTLYRLGRARLLFYSFATMQLN